MNQDDTMERLLSLNLFHESFVTYPLRFGRTLDMSYVQQMSNRKQCLTQGSDARLQQLLLVLLQRVCAERFKYSINIGAIEQSDTDKALKDRDGVLWLMERMKRDSTPVFINVVAYTKTDAHAMYVVYFPFAKTRRHRGKLMTKKIWIDTAAVVTNTKYNIIYSVINKHLAELEKEAEIDVEEDYCIQELQNTGSCGFYSTYIAMILMFNIDMFQTLFLRGFKFSTLCKNMSEISDIDEEKFFANMYWMLGGTIAKAYKHVENELNDMRLTRGQEQLPFLRTMEILVTANIVISDRSLGLLIKQLQTYKDYIHVEYHKFFEDEDEKM